MRRKFLIKINFPFFIFWKSFERGNDTQKKREETKFKSVEIGCKIAPPPLPMARERGNVTLEKCLGQLEMKGGEGSFKPL